MYAHPTGRILIRSGLFIAAALSFVLLTDPQRVPSALLVVPFVLLFAALTSAIIALIQVMRRDDETVLGAAVRRPRVLAALLAAFPVLMLVLQSIGQLSIWDLATAGGILIVAYIYVSRSTVSFFR